jgi:hypothetical protein
MSPQQEGQHVVQFDDVGAAVGAAIVRAMKTDLDGADIVVERVFGEDTPQAVLRQHRDARLHGLAVRSGSQLMADVSGEVMVEIEKARAERRRVARHRAIEAILSSRPPPNGKAP